ncbi:MAG: hypothetical protein PF545_05920 [Elusimicrobia bacterium]|jgi:hypothetical protein|nr:hypothetical protein [Elusimicrobiota bacterium]
MDQRQSAKVIVYIKDVKIEGSIYTRGEYTRGRISDALNRDKENFLAITGAKIFDYATSKELDEKDFMFVNKRQILYVKPKEQGNG